MKNKEKKLLLQVLCSMLPYGVKIATRIVGNTTFSDSCLSGELLDDFIKKEWGEIKPYLRPMSSMTEEERLELSRLTDDKFKFYLYTTKPEIICYEKYNYLEGLKVLDWLNSNYFDYLGLIPMGLALPAPEGMYKEGGEK